MQTEENRKASSKDIARPEPSIGLEVSTSYPLEVKRDLAGGEEDPSHTHGYKLSWRPTETHVFVSANGTKMCHVGLVRQTVQISGASLDVAGVGGVLVRSSERGHGYGRVAMEGAQDFAAREWKVGFMLLFCREALRSWYDALGWRKVLGATWADQPTGPIVLPLDSMWKSLNGTSWPHGDVHLHSRPW